MDNMVGKKYHFVSGGDYLLVPHDWGSSLFETSTGKEVLSTENKKPQIVGDNFILLKYGEVWDLNSLTSHIVDEEIETLVIVTDKNDNLKYIINEKHTWREDDYFKNYAYTVKYKTNVNLFNIEIYRTGNDECLLTIPMPDRTGGYRVKEKDNLVIIERDHDRQFDDDDRIYINLETGDVTSHFMGKISLRTLKREPGKETLYKTNLFKEDTKDYQIYSTNDIKSLEDITLNYKLPKEIKGYNVCDISSDTSLFVCDKINSNKYVGIFAKAEIDNYFSQKRIRTIGFWALIIIAVIIYAVINLKNEKSKNEPQKQKAKNKNQHQVNQKQKPKKTPQKKPVEKVKKIEEEPEADMEQIRIFASFAAQQGNIQELESYLKKGIDINDINEYGSTLLMDAIDNKQYNMAKYLLKKGANPDICGPDSRPPLVDIASSTGDPEFSKMLLEHGANVNITYYNGTTPLHYAAEYMFTELTKLLLEHGADAKKKNNSGIAPINGKACHYPEILLALLAAGADPLNIGQNGKTTLMDAAEGNSLQSVQILIKAGLNPNAMDNDGNRAIDFAKQEKNHVIVEFLEKKSAPARKGLNPSMLPNNLGQPGSISASAPKPDIEVIVKSLGFKDFNHFHECLKYSSTDFTEEMQNEVAGILKAPIKEADDTRYFYSSEGIFCYSQKSGSHDNTADQSRVYYNYLGGIYFLCIAPEKEYVEVLHFRWTDNITIQAIDITNVTRKENGWEEFELYIDYVKNQVTNWLSWNKEQNIKEAPENKDAKEKLFAYLKENNIEFSTDEKSIVVKNELNLRGAKINKLPVGLTIEGSLDLSGESIENLPNNLTVNGNCYLSSTNITSLPDNLKIEKTLGLRGTKIKSLPKCIAVGDSIGLADTLIEEIPEGLAIGGDLVLADTPIKQLPEGLVIGRHLDIRGTKISSLPPDLKVKGDLLLEDSGVSSVPDSIEVGGNIEK